MKLLIGIMTSILLTACAAPIKTEEDVVKSIKMKTGASDCIGCNQIKTFITGRVSSSFYSKKDDRGMNSGGWISTSASLGITNKSASLVRQGGGALFESLIYAKSLTGNGHIFEGKFNADPSHPYRFFVNIHHNSSFGTYDSYIVYEDKFISLPPVRFQGEILDKSCFDKGCVWDETYAIPATLIYKSVERNVPLNLFFGNRVTKQVASKDGLNKSYEIFNEGLVLQIEPAHLNSFTSKVEEILRN